MSKQPLRSLRWYEHWMLRFLVQSPRIDRIQVFQYPDPEPDTLAAENDAMDFWIDHFEEMYHAPALDPREGG